MSSSGWPGDEELALQAAAVVGKLRPYAWASLAADLTVESASPGFPALAGLGHDDIAGRPITALLWELVGAEEALLQVLAGEEASLRLDNVRRDGGDDEGRYVTIHVTRVDATRLDGRSAKDDGQEARLLLLIEDSSDLGRMQQRLVQDRNELKLARRQLESANAALRQLNRQKSLYLAMAAHDLRTPLTSIQGFTHLVRADLPDELTEQREMLDIVHAQSEKLQRLIADLLDLEIIEQGQLSIRRRECILNDMLYQVLAAMRPAMNLQELALETSIPEEPLVLQADPMRLEQIIYNLVGNALKYSPTGGKVIVAAGREAANTIFRVTNEGRALTEGQIRRLFDAYYRTEDARQSRSKGSGLGLYIVKMLVEAHGGDVWVQSGEEKGNQFSVRLPAVARDQEVIGGR